ncbi:MAG: hypothetical protein L3K15_05570 [Thermoplasmata archaeon]|nr:hypothetical protein [Thermoplasmata archaeon]
MRLRFHRGGKTRTWLGAKFGGDFELGDRIWRRVLHFAGAFVLLYFLLPPHFFLIVTNLEALLLALAAVLVLELLRHVAHAELPTIRPHEQRWVASFAFYAVALVAAVVLFPAPIATVVVLGTSLVDPLIGELRVRHASAPTRLGLPLVAYFGFGVAGFAVAWHVPLTVAVPAAGVAAWTAVLVESPRIRGVDDDLAMTLVPAIVLAILAIVYPVFGPLRG